MPPLLTRVGTVLALSVFLLAARASGARGQRGKPVQEFTRQGLLVTNFSVSKGGDVRMGRHAGDELRDRVAKLVDKRAIDVITGTAIREKMFRAGFNPDTTYPIEQLFSIGRSLRADEYVEAGMRSGPSGTRLDATLVLMRDKRLRQPLPAVTAPTLDEAADLLARHVNAALVELVHQRRCENALREGKGDVAIESARQAIAAYPASTLGRICLMWSLQATHAPVREVLAVAREVLERDSTSFHAIEAAAVALDSLHQKEPAGDMWMRLAATDTDDLDLAHRVIFALAATGNSRRAEPFVLHLADQFRDNLPLAQQKWRVTFENRNWPRAVEAGEFLVAQDSVARADSTFWLRLATVYKAAGKPFKAVQTLAFAVEKFPKDPRMYSLYTQYVRAEADTVIPRGLAIFPKSAELLALNARDLRAKGKLQESLDASKQAVSIDSTMGQGELMVAQLEVELGRPDSALSSLRRALSRGEDSALVAQFALAKGNTLYRAANATHVSGDFALALRFLALADTVRTSVQSRFLVGATALGLAQAALTEAPKLSDKVESCRLARLGADMVPVAQAGLQAGQEAYADAAKQSLDYLGQLDKYVVQQLAAYCGPGGARP